MTLIRVQPEQLDANSLRIARDSAQLRSAVAGLNAARGFNAHDLSGRFGPNLRAKIDQGLGAGNGVSNTTQGRGDALKRIADAFAGADMEAVVGIQVLCHPTTGCAGTAMGPVKRAEQAVKPAN